MDFYLTIKHKMDSFLNRQDPKRMSSHLQIFRSVLAGSDHSSSEEMGWLCSPAVAGYPSQWRLCSIGDGDGVAPAESNGTTRLCGWLAAAKGCSTLDAQRFGGRRRCTYYRGGDKKYGCCGDCRRAEVGAQIFALGQSITTGQLNFIWVSEPVGSFCGGGPVCGPF